jgi:hypothetical protein
MNWDAMAAIAEIVASFGVIVSLIYLATQIRNQRSESLLSAGHELASQLNDLYAVVSENAEFADLFLRGMTEYKSLDSVEKLRFSAFFSRLMRIHESMNSRHRQKLLDPTIWQSYEESMRDYFNYAGLRDWWATRSHWFTPEFREFISGCIANERDSNVFDLHR